MAAHHLSRRAVVEATLFVAAVLVADAVVPHALCARKQLYLCIALLALHRAAIAHGTRTTVLTIGAKGAGLRERVGVALPAVVACALSHDDRGIVIASRGRVGVAGV